MVTTRSFVLAAMIRAGSLIPATGIRLSAALTLAVVALAGAGDGGSSAAGDFDASGTVDLADHPLFLEGFGS